MTTPTSPTRVYFLGPRSAPVEELSTVSVDLDHLFSIIPIVGRNAAMLYLTIRALRQRAGVTSFQTADLVWMLRARPFRIRLWMQRLAKAGLLVYTMTSGGFSDVLLLELAPRAGGGREHDIPTHWFPHELPRLRRVGFLVYLWVRSHEWGGDVATVAKTRLARDLRLHPFRARFHLWRLRRVGLVRRERREFVVRDPAPLSLPAHAAVRLRELRVIPWTVLQVALALLVGIALVAVLLALHTH